MVKGHKKMKSHNANIKGSCSAYVLHNISYLPLIHSFSVILNGLLWYLPFNAKGGLSLLAKLDEASKGGNTRLF